MSAWQRMNGISGAIAQPTSARSGVWWSIPASARYALALAVGMRLALSALAAWLLSFRVPAATVMTHAQYLGQRPLHDLVVAPWQRFDALWYVHIAAYGYGAHDGSTVYFPLYPLLIRLITPLAGGNGLLAALLVSNACFAGLLVVLYALVASRYGDGAARRALVLLCLFPTAVFLLSPYTESLFLLLTVGTFMALDRRRWLLAGALAFLAALTRVQGIVLALPLLYAAISSLTTHHSSLLRDRRDTCSSRPALAPWCAAALPVLGMAIFLTYVKLVVRGGAITSTLQAHWNLSINPPWVTLANFWAALSAHHWHIFAYPTGNWVDLMNLALALGALALVIPSRRLLGTPLWLYSLATWVVVLSLHQSTARYMLTVFPAVIVLAVRARGRLAMRLALLLGAPLMLFAAGEFVMWSFVG